MDLKDLGPDAARSIAFCLSEPAEKYENDPEVEFLWAMKAMEHAEVHFNLVSSVDPRKLRLTEHDDRLYADLKQSFPEFHLSPLVTDELKSEEAKEKWRTFMKEYENDIADFNYATLLRIDANEDYSENNTIVVPRVQFVVIEVARNREGFNDELRTKYPPSGKKQA